MRKTATKAHRGLATRPRFRMSAPMNPARFFPALTLIAALCVALASMALAGRMAPVGQNAPDYLAFVVMAGPDALCEGHDADHSNHDCPFCRLLADPVAPVRAHVFWQLDPWVTVQHQHDLTVHSQRHHRPSFARGPPHAG